MIDHLTVQSYALAMAHQYIAGEVEDMHVQFRRRGEVFCGRVIDAADGERGEFFKLRSVLGDVWAPAKNVVRCSGVDGRCACEIAASAAAARAASREAGARGACAVPLGNTGTTTYAVCGGVR